LHLEKKESVFVAAHTSAGKNSIFLQFLGFWEFLVYLVLLAYLYFFFTEKAGIFLGKYFLNF
jgi:hypothetical protein